METITIKRTYVPYCQVCAKDFKPLELVWYAPIDNNIVCEECSRIHKDREPRLFSQQDIPSVVCPDCGEVDNISVVEGCIFPVLPVPNHSAECGKCGCAWSVD